MTLRGRRCLRGGEVLGARDDRSCEVGELAVVGAGVAAQGGERLVHVDVQPLGEDALGLLDQNAAVQCGLQLNDHGVGLEIGAMLQDGGGGDVGQRLGDPNVGEVETGGGRE